jgi:5-(carboxyamino)imidazole ribonucleotide synthase
MMNKMITPYQTVGIIGGGQLGRMMALAAKAMGYTVAVLEPVPNCPCGQVSDIEITADYGDIDAVRKLAEVSDVITYEFENIDSNALAFLEENAYLPQGSRVLKTTQHRYSEKKAIADMGLPVPEFFLADTVEKFEEVFFYPSVLKTCMGGYDGKGQVVIKSENDRDAARALVTRQECILERWMPFSKEISVIIARNTHGESSVFPVSENIHINNILHQSIVPARISPELEIRAVECARKIADGLNAVGVLAIEMFVVGDEIYINELAPRPHNSGHYTIDACETSQFEQHIRAVCGLPLGSTRLHTPVVMVNILGDHMDRSNLSSLSPYLPLLPKGKLHLYGKAEAKLGRKMGHINILGNIDDSLQLAEMSGIWCKNK